jgi:carbon dioxide concentrating mechanism protein CcmO
MDIRESALGMVSTMSLPAVVSAADMMLKSATVLFMGYEKIGSGFCTAVVRGRITDVRLAVAAGVDQAKLFGEEVTSSIIARPYPNLDQVLPIGHHLRRLAPEGPNRLSSLAIGLLETTGFPAMVGACDAMLKSADVHLAAYETIGSGLCTAIIRGNVADVTMAIEIGMYEAERIGDFHSLTIIPRPLADLEDTLPVAQCWLEQPQPLRIPLQIPELEQESLTLEPLE